MYKLYNVKCWGSMAVHLLLEELGVPYINVWMTAAEVKAPEFRNVSPLGLIPALALANGRTMIESAAMVSFLTTAHADKGLGPTPGSAGPRHLPLVAAFHVDQHVPVGRFRRRRRRHGVLQNSIASTPSSSANSTARGRS